MNYGLEKFGINDYELDSFKNTNIRVFDKEEEYYNENGRIKILSLVSIMLFDLGILFEDYE